MANIKINGQWLTDQAGEFVDLQWSSRHRGGCEAASWRVDSTKLLPYRPGALVEISHDGIGVFTGTLLEPDGDTMHARGLYYQGEALALDASNNATVNPDVALFSGIITRGVLNWVQPVSLSNADFGVAAAPMKVNDLLTAWADSAGKVIRVNAARQVLAVTPAATPRWFVSPGTAELTVARDSFVTDLYGVYLDSTTGQYAKVPAFVQAARDRFGRKEGTEDLTPAGSISAAQATAITNARVLELSRPGWANNLRLASWELTTAGDAPANLRDVRGGDMIRIMGQMDMTIASGLQPYIDVIADEVSYVDGSDLIDIKPLGYEPRSFTDVLAAALG